MSYNIAIEVHSIEQLLSSIPAHAQDLYHITIKCNDGIFYPAPTAYLTLIKDGEVPTGWDTIQQDLQKAIDDVKYLRKQKGVRT